MLLRKESAKDFGAGKNAKVSKRGDVCLPRPELINEFRSILNEFAYDAIKAKVSFKSIWRVPAMVKWIVLYS